MMLPFFFKTSKKGGDIAISLCVYTGDLYPHRAVERRRYLIRVLLFSCLLIVNDSRDRARR
jgi:hypothetical protein